MLSLQQNWLFAEIDWFGDMNIVGLSCVVSVMVFIPNKIIFENVWCLLPLLLIYAYYHDYGFVSCDILFQQDIFIFV